MPATGKTALGCWSGLADNGCRLSSVRNAFGRQLSFAYDGAGRSSQLIDPANAITQYGYDGIGNLATIIWPDGNLRRYHYEDARWSNALTGITDEAGVRCSTRSCRSATE